MRPEGADRMANSADSVQTSRIARVSEKYLENEIFSRSGKSQGILWMAREM